MDRSDPPFPFDALVCGVAAVAADGGLQPCNATMRELLAAWSPDDDERDRLLGGEALQVAAAGRSFDVRCAGAAPARWLVARPLDDDGGAVAARMAAARVRQLGLLAGKIAHELNNLFGSAMGLASLLGPQASDPADRRLVEELSLGAQRGATMARALARLLKSGPRQWQPVALGGLVDEVLAIAGRLAKARGIELLTKVAEPLPTIRGVAAEVSQVLLHGTLALLGAEPRRLAIEAGALRQAVGGGRDRACVRVRLVAEGCRQALGTGGAVPADWQLLAALALRRAGGEMTIAANGDAATVDYVWPALASA